MSRFCILISVVAVIAALALTGCGGGGGGGTAAVTEPNPPALGERVITGRVVSSTSGAPGVANVTVTLGSGTAVATTDSSGNFQLKLPAGTTNIPAYLQLDSTGAGTGYSREYPVTYSGQQFLATEITVPVGIRNEVTNSLGTFTVLYVGVDEVPPPPYTNKDTVLTGRIIRSDNFAGIANVTVTFGTPAITVKTGKNGYFALNLGREAPVLPLLPSAKIFSINSSTAGSSYPTTILVSYGNSVSPQSAVPVPMEIYTNQATDFSNITLLVSSGDGGDDGGVPPPPVF